MVKVLLSGGGTLGSVSPLIAIRQAWPDADYLFIGTKEGPEHHFAEVHGIRYRHIAAAKLRRYFSVQNFIDILRFPIGILQAMYLVASYRPDIILTSGGFVAVPVGIAGWILRCPLVMHQQDVEIGMANKILRYFATVITVTFPEQAHYFPKHKVHVTGNPVRSFGFAPDQEENMILILGGSQGARGMNEALNKIIPDLAKEYEIVHVLGQKNYNQRLGLSSNYEPKQFLSDDFGSYVSRAGLVISRAGMSTITELAACKKATGLIPIPGTHQELNVSFLSKHDAVLCLDQRKPADMYGDIIGLMHNAKKRKAMGEQLHRQFPADATKRYLNLIRDMLREKMEHQHPVAYFIGIGGIGVSSLVRYFKEKGYRIFGSDLSRNEITRRLENEGATIFFSQERHNIPEATKIVIYSSAVPASNSELQETKRRHLEHHTYNEYLGILSKQYTTVAISGTHGKTTTTALLGTTLMGSKFDPSIIVGSLIPQLGFSNFRHGTTNWLIAEACEYRSHMLLVQPEVIILTNIDEDHLDYYRDLEDIKYHFKRFVDKLPASGVLIKNADDQNSSSLHGPTTITYGFSELADYRATQVKLGQGYHQFTVVHNSTELGTYTLGIPGKFNILNALSVIAFGHHFKVPTDLLQRGITQFKGSWRRAELVGEYSGVTVYSDYAHHPTEIKATLRAFKEFHAGQRLVVVYQPHSYDRTQVLLHDFATSFDDADVLILSEVYDVAGRDIEHRVSSKDILDKMQHPSAHYAADLEQAEQAARDSIQPGDILICMGAGNIDQIARSLVKQV